MPAFGHNRRNRRRRRRAVLSPFEATLSNFSRVVRYDPVTGAVEGDSDNETEPDKPGEEALMVTKVDLDIRNNTRSHHTDEFDITNALVYDPREELVIRRGQEFNMKIDFNRPYNEESDDLRLVFQFGQNPHPSRGSHVEFILSDEDNPKEWGAYIQSKQDNTISLVLTTPPTCAVGKWSLKIDVVKKTNTAANLYRYSHKDPIFVLFNPWCKDDTVYMDENLLKEYVLNESGKIYAGSLRKISAKPWEFGQFSGEVLDCVIYLLDKKSGIKDQARGDPILVSRAISSLLNDCDDEGVLSGNWTGDYTGGTSPLDWTGSVAILEQYYKTKKPVRYGQCWVFSGIVTTVCRALGIPARSVTNFASAHDTDGSITIDTFFNKNGEEMEELNNDSVWNFHVWNDVWMARPDLPKGYGGWQAIDATPQETSGGVYCMGPMSLVAIKRGEVYLPYDGPFVFSEVNADKVIWKQDDSGKLVKTGVVKNSVGFFISTKKAFGKSSWSNWRVGNDPDWEDVTDDYKFKEGSEEERAAVRQASLKSTREDVYEPCKNKDITFTLTIPDNAFIGDSLEILLKITNTSDTTRTVNGTLKISTMYYTGTAFQEVKKHCLAKETLKGKQEKIVPIKIGVDEYLDKTTDHFMFKSSCLLMVTETEQVFADLKDFRLRKPHLTIKAPDQCCVGKEFEVQVSFENPLAVTLTKCELRVEGPGYQRPVIYPQSNVDAKKTFTGCFKMTPVKPGDKQITVYFNSLQISAVTVSHPVNVKA